MANMTIPNEGKLLWAQWAIISSNVAIEDYVCDLYQNNVSITANVTAATFTPCNFAGYAQVAIPRNSFNTPTIVANVAYTTSNVTPTYTSTDTVSQTAYGYFLRGATSGKCLAAQPFAAPRPMTSGATEQLTPFTLGLATLGTSPPG